MKPISKYFISIFFLFCTVGYAHSEDTNALQIYDKVTSEISLRPWETKGLGKVTSKETISVIKTKSGKGHVVILKWNDSMDSFDVEVYKREGSDGKPDTWQITNSDLDKTLTDQHGHFYMIQHTTPGPEGGIISQTFKLR